MPFTDPIVLALLLTSLILSLGYQWRRGLRWRPLGVTAFAMWFSLGVISTMVMHELDVLHGLATHRTSMTGSRFAYDWRTYSLLLFGALMIWFGARCLRAALRMGRGEESARLEFLRLVGVMLLIVLPLIPVSPFFGPIASVWSTLGMLVVGLGGRRWSVAARATDASPIATT